MLDLASRRRARDLAGAVICLMCGRIVGRFQQGQLRIESTKPSLRREGRQLRCGYCRGNVYLDPDLGVRPERADEPVKVNGPRRGRSA